MHKLQRYIRTFREIHRTVDRYTDKQTKIQTSR
jgi:hypothetical protein